MKPIPNNFRKNGYDYRLLEREGNVAIYEQVKPNRVYAFEVVKIRSSKARSAFGHDFEAAERLPSDDDWGTLGKTYSCWEWSPSSHSDARRLAKAQMGVWVAEEAENALKRPKS